MNYSVAANTGAARTGTLTVAGQTVTVTQAAGTSCTYTVSPTTVSVPAAGDSDTIAVTTGSTCGWTATSSVGWITFTSGGSGTGSGSVNYTVARNTTTSSRSGTLTIAGRTVTVTQNAATPPSAPTGFRIVQQ